MSDDPTPPRLADVADAERIARLLHDFNLEYDSPTPGVAAIATRLRELLAGRDTFAVVAGDPAVGVAVVTLRPNLWYDGPVALLDELYVAPDLRSRGIGAAILALTVQICRDRGVRLVEIGVDEPDVDAQRFYARNGFSPLDPDLGVRALLYHRELL